MDSGRAVIGDGLLFHFLGCYAEFGESALRAMVRALPRAEGSGAARLGKRPAPCRGRPKNLNPSGLYRYPSERGKDKWLFS